MMTSPPTIDPIFESDQKTDESAGIAHFEKGHFVEFCILWFISF
jgi:hypothetical protein